MAPASFLLSQGALKKMAAQLKIHKKILYNAYLKVDRKALEFTGQNDNL
jgi:hypothetical protein